MSLSGKLEIEVEIEAPASKFYELFCRKPYEIPIMCPHLIKSCDLDEGEWGKQGSVLRMTYDQGGVQQTTRELVESIDDENFSTSLNLLEGEFLKDFKSKISKLKITPKGEGSVVLWTLEYEKRSLSVADPLPLLEILVFMTKDLSAHLTKG